MKINVTIDHQVGLITNSSSEIFIVKEEDISSIPELEKPLSSMSWKSISEEDLKIILGISLSEILCGMYPEKGDPKSQIYTYQQYMSNLRSPLSQFPGLLTIDLFYHLYSIAIEVKEEKLINNNLNTWDKITYSSVGFSKWFESIKGEYLSYYVDYLVLTLDLPSNLDLIDSIYYDFKKFLPGKYDHQYLVESHVDEDYL